ncbi:hypothetical protein B0H14DRAFT_2366286 [Mycena olivaceomarginata]|nr:hypothetical protein B0H14DRAFT_2366286 [Mycena olivaceomarginata]
MKKPLDKEFLAFLLLHSLPTDLKWETFKTSMLNSVPVGVTLDFGDISEQLIADAIRVDGDSAETPASESTLKSRPSKPSKKAKSEKWWSFHRSTTHNTDECKSLAAQKSSKKDRKKGKRERQKAHRMDDGSDSDSDSSSSSSSSSSEDEQAQFSAKAEKHKTRNHHVKVDKSLMTHIHAYLGTDLKPPELNILADSGASGDMTPCDGVFYGISKADTAGPIDRLPYFRSHVPISLHHVDHVIIILTCHLL